MSSASLPPPPQRQAYRANYSTPPRTPPLSDDKPLELGPPPTAGSSASAVAVDALSATEMESHLAAFESLGPPGASRRPTRRVRSIERTWTWVKSRSSVYGEQSLLNGGSLDDEVAQELGISRPMTVAATGNMNVSPASPRRNSTADMDPEERRRRRQGIVPNNVSAGNGLRPPPRPRPMSRSFTSPVSPLDEFPSSSSPFIPTPSPSLSSSTSERRERRRPLPPRPLPTPPRPLPIFPPGPADTDSPPDSAYHTPTTGPIDGRAAQPSPAPPQQPPSSTLPAHTAASIHDIVKRHSSAVAQAEEGVKDRARAELALRPDLLASVRSRKKSSPVKGSPKISLSRGNTPPPPPLPSTLEPQLKLEPASKNNTPSSSRPYTHRRHPSSSANTMSSDTSDSYVNEIRLAQAAYDHLTPKPTTPTIPSAPAPAPALTPPPATSFTPHTRTILSPTPEHSPRGKYTPRDLDIRERERDRDYRDRDRDRDRDRTPQRHDLDSGTRNRSNASLNRSKSASPMPPEDDSHAIALYLRSPQLNRILLIARPPPERPLQVSVADLGKPDGRPVVVFLGLGCVRYLIALYDDLARALGLRLICIDRWGLGKTDQIPQNQRGLLDWADVVSRVLDELGVDRFQVLAHSAGAPYALATVLKMERRVRGKIHLLAPWVGGDVEGYRWLKWVPNSVIKSALAAEWRLESYFLGKAPTIKNSIRSKSEAMMSSSSVDSDGTRSRTSFGQDPPRPDSRLGAVEVDGFDTLASDLYPAAPGGWTTTPPPVSVSSVSSSPGFTQALMQASHAESLSGTTADLLSVVLGRDAKPWGFSYTDIRHPCKIWYGAEDERVSEKSMRWMERAMDAELLVAPGEGHNLMSSRTIMFDVLDSLAEDI